MHRSSRVRLKYCLLLAAACAGPALLVAACGGKSSEEDGETVGSASAAGQDGGPGSEGGSGGKSGAGGSAGGSASGGSPFTGLDAGAAECLDCVSAACPEAQACLADPSCMQGAVCAATSCTQVGDGGDAIACWLGCFNGNTEAALNAFTAFSCLLANCQQDCTGAL